ncbi:sensor histidine kinase [Marinoscillum sp.]|uniref:sensor histidine kinase n=1 Tax=Marinoscillum sp. TaxID=2024838 RepID=UPI003BA93955
MKNLPIRILVIVGALSMAAIVVVQIFWITQVMDRQEEMFDRSVQMALRNVVESLCEINGNDIPSNDPIDQLSKNYFIARTNYKIDLSSLDYLLKAELQKRSIDLDYEYGVYDCQSDRMVYGDFVELNSKQGKVQPAGKLPKLVNDEYYFGIFFPGKTAGLVNMLGIWKVTSVLILIILIVFSYALFVILKQKRLSEIQRDFVNNMTHEFKTPLATLQVSAEVLGNEVKEPRQQKYTEIIKSELVRLEQHVHQLLKTSMLDHQVMANEQIEVINCLETMGQKFERLHPGKLHVQIDLPPKTAVRGDRVVFETMVYNLLDNAFKYGTAAVGFTVRREGRSVLIAITNHGPTIPPQERKKIFHKFYRIHQGDLHDVKGFGLGLYFVKQGARSMKGKVTLVSQNNETTFTLKIPIDEA